MASSITVLDFDNRPFVRSLTARAVGVNNTDTIRWNYPSFATAQTTAFTPYTENSAGLVNQIGTLIFSFSADTYDYTTTGYTLCSLPLSCISVTALTTATTGIEFDTFPDIDLTLFINYENTDSDSFFYRLTSFDPLLASPGTDPYFINIASTKYNLASSLSEDSYIAWYSLNRATTRLTDLTALTGFERIPGTQLSSVQAVISATSAPGSVEPWFSSHILERSLSCVFVPYFLSGDFIGYPRGYLPTKSTFDVLTPSTYTNSPGMFFYGEGHTETIILSSAIDPRTTTNIWRLDNTTTKYTVSASNMSQPLLTAFVTLTSLTGTNVTIPVSLQLTNNIFLSTAPRYFYDDITGEITPYPYFISTTDSEGNELTPRNKLKESIQIKPYDDTIFEFTPGIAPETYLPINGSQVNYLATLKNNILAQDALQPCFGKYGLIWNWITYSNCSASPETFSGKPSSWLTVACSGTFPKQWTIGDVLSTDLFDTRFAQYSAIDMTWTLSTENWSVQTTALPLSVNEFPYNLSLLDFGDTVYTTSFFDDTPVTINAVQTIQALISAQFTAAALALGYTNDWQIKTTTFNQSFSTLSVAPPVAKLYTPNRFVLTGANVGFENLFTNTKLLSTVIIDLDDGKTIQLNGSQVDRSFSATYDVVGSKTITVYMYPNYEPNPIVTRFPDIIQVLSEYDQVSPTEYRSTETPIELPWPEKPHVGPNDWAVEDNINNLFIKFFENLNYLESRGRIYPGAFSDYFGYLGVQPTVVGGLTACPTWTWEDVDCFNTSLPYTVTWRDVLSADDPFDQSGDFAVQGCGTWATHECTNRQINPTCYGLYEVAWSWRQRKRGSSLVPITWKQTKESNEFQKRWYFEPSEEQFLVACNEGIWNVNILGLNQFYDPIATPAVQQRCIYNGIASRNNILYTNLKTQIKLLSSNQTATFFDYEDTVDGVVQFSDLKNICLDSVGKIYVLDGLLSQVVAYTYESNAPGDAFKRFVNWGGFGTAASTTRFSSPNDIHVDQLDNIWVTDTGNGCVKHYSNSGTWLKTIIDDTLKEEVPLSTAVDSQRNVHILTNESIRVYSYEGAYLYSYSFKEQTTDIPRKINSSYNREVIYLALKTQVLKYFRNGVFFSYIIKQKDNVSNITGVYHDEFRNLLITTDDKILKYPDVMTIRRLKGLLPTNYWSLEDVLIHKEEYIQNWVYTRAFQRMWDNIEIFRNTLLFDNTFCKGYVPPVHNKEKMIVGQNEIVTSETINRVLSYLWDNFKTLTNYFDPGCEEPI